MTFTVRMVSGQLIRFDTDRIADRLHLAGHIRRGSVIRVLRTSPSWEAKRWVFLNFAHVEEIR